MSFAILVRNRNTERIVALVSALAVLLSMMVIFADRAQAHHPELTASQTCVAGDVAVNWLSESWLQTGASGSAHNDIRIQRSVEGGPWVEIAQGAYTDGNGYEFSGSFDASGFWQQTLRLRAYANGPWVNGQGGGEYSEITTITINQDCFNPSCPDGYEEYKIDFKPSNGTYGDHFTISNFTNGANGETFDWSSDVPVFQVIVKGGPTANIYNYSGATSDTGLHATTNPNNGKYYGVSHVTFCWDDSQPTETTFSIGGECVYDGTANYTVAGVLGEGLTLEVNDAPVAVNPDGSFSVAGSASNTYEVTVADGYVLADDAPDASGTINIEDCTPIPTETTFSIGGECVYDGAANYTVAGVLGEGLTLEVNGVPVVVNLDGSFSVAGSASNTYEVTVANGYVLADDAPDASGTIDIEDCTPPPSGYVCYEGSVIPANEAPPGFNGTVYNTPQEAADDEDCIDVNAATTFTISGSCLLDDGVPSFTISGNLGEGVTLEVAGETLTASGAYSIDLGAPGSYPYEVTLDDGFVLADGSPPTNGTVTIVDCTQAPESGWACVDGEPTFIPDATNFTGTLYPSAAEAADDPDCIEVNASIVVTVASACASDGEGEIDVTLSVADGAVVTVSNSSGTILATFTDDGTLDVPDNASYTWTATPNEGFEFPAGSATTGSVTIETCVDELPFTGFDTGLLLIAAMALLAAGAAVLYLLGEPDKRTI